MKKILYICVTIFFLTIAVSVNGQDSSARINSIFNTYITAHNEHDLATLDKLFDQSADFLLIYNGKEYWGAPDAIEAAEKLHKGGLVVEPAADKMKVIQLSAHAAQIFIPAMYTYREGGRQVKRNFLLNMTLAMRGDEWKVMSVMYVPAVITK